MLPSGFIIRIKMSVYSSGIVRSLEAALSKLQCPDVDRVVNSRELETRW